MSIAMTDSSTLYPSIDINRLPQFRPVVSASSDAMRSIPSENAIVASKDKPTLSPRELLETTR